MRQNLPYRFFSQSKTDGDQDGSFKVGGSFFLDAVANHPAHHGTTHGTNGTAAGKHSTGNTADAGADRSVCATLGHAAASGKTGNHQKRAD